MTKHEFKSKAILSKEEAEIYRLPWEHQLANISPKAKNEDNNNNNINGNPKKSPKSRRCLCCVLICCPTPADGRTVSTKTLVSNEDEDGNIKPTKGQVELWSSDFKHLINDANGRKLFAVFLREEYCEENLEFWVEVENFKKAEGDMLTKANSIYLMFVKPMSDREVNLSGATRKKIAEEIQNGELSPDLFDSAQSQVQYLMHRQSYPRFLTSSHLKEAL